MDPELERLFAEIRRIVLEDKDTEFLFRGSAKRGPRDRLFAMREGGERFEPLTLEAFEAGTVLAEKRAAAAIEKLEEVRRLLQRAQVLTLRRVPYRGQPVVDVLVPSDATEITVMVGNDLATYKGTPVDIAHELMLDGVNARLVRWTTAELNAIRGRLTEVERQAWRERR